jgi:hypothetical protein
MKNYNLDSGSVRWLLVGLAAVTFTVGYMIGGSQTPVVGAVIPAVFGLLASAASVVRSRSNANKGTNREDPDSEQERVLGESSRFEDSSVWWASPAVVGKCMLVFGLFFLTGTVVGGLARVNQWLVVPRHAALSESFGLTKADTELDLKSALEWVTLRGALQDTGCTDDELAAIFSIFKTGEKENDSLDSDIQSLLELLAKAGSVPGASTPAIFSPPGEQEERDGELPFSVGFFLGQQGATEPSTSPLEMPSYDEWNQTVEDLARFSDGDLEEVLVLLEEIHAESPETADLLDRIDTGIEGRLGDPITGDIPELPPVSIPDLQMGPTSIPPDLLRDLIDMRRGNPRAPIEAFTERVEQIPHGSLFGGQNQ